MSESDRQKIGEWCFGYSRSDDLLLVRKLRGKGLCDREILAVLEVISSTCNRCWDDEKDCKCQCDW